MLQKYMVILIAMVLLAGNSLANGKYKSYRSKDSDQYLLKFSIGDNHYIMTIYGNGDSETLVFNKSEVNRSREGITIKDSPVFSSDKISYKEFSYPLSLINRIEIKEDEKGPQVYFIKKSSSQVNKTFGRKKNRISLQKDIIVESDEFIRGSVVSFWADIEINGEVNNDIVAIFGNITIGDDAVIRGDIVAFDGHVNVSKNASIYGDIQSSNSNNKFSFSRRRRYFHRDKYFTELGRFYYNRVDGAAPYLGFKFVDEDSLLPEISLYGGYGFASERWRYQLEVEQSILQSMSVSIGGSIYRRLASDDDRMIPEALNTFFALVATEDYKDYYEAEGGYGFIKFRPIQQMSLEAGLLIEKHRWLEGNRELWSLFGGSKRFPLNFSSLPDEVRTNGIEEIASSEIASLKGIMEFEYADDGQKSEQSFWKGFAEIEWLPKAWNDDYDFTRGQTGVSRMQSLSRYIRIYSSIAYGNSSGHLPIHRKFYLGGFGSLPGYRQKELFGDKFWQTDLEYGVTFPHSDITGWLFYFAGQTAEDKAGFADTEIKQSLGIGLSFEGNLRVNIARRLDISDPSFRLYVGFGFIF